MLIVILTILIALIDTGIDLNHSHFDNSIITGVSLVDEELTDNCGVLGHGTRVASVIIDRTPEASLLVVKVGEPCRASTDNIAEGIRYATDYGADIISISYSSPYTYTNIEDAISYATLNNVTLVSSVGNDSEDQPHYPAAYPEVIGVGCDTEDYPFSNYGAWVDVIVPCSFRAAIPGEPEQYVYNSVSTSLAAPYHAATLADEMMPTILLPLVVLD